VMWPIMEAMSSLSVVVLLWYGGYLVLHDPNFDAGAFVAFFRALSRLTWPLISLGFMISVIERGRASFSRVREVLEAKPDIQGGSLSLPPGPLVLQVNDLSFSYGARQVLAGISFELKAGESLAIVGRTGSGKSTLAQLLARLQPTPRGAIHLNGVDICDLPLETLRGAVGYAQQDPFLFSTTVGRNLGYALDDPDSSEAERQIRLAASEAQILDEVTALPDGFDTVVGERGVQLSGGQKQRVSLGRALASEPSILVLDDPLSAVDGRTENAILAAMDRQRLRRSVILITHRISAAKRCDRVIVIDQGKIVEAGTPSQLEAASGLYASFAEEQRIETELAGLGGTPPVGVPQALSAEE
jgi:ATP-binding cassette, subfamily B, multidrug efflux pump